MRDARVVPRIVTGLFHGAVRGLLCPLDAVQRTIAPMDLIQHFLRHLAVNVNASPQTVRCYRADLHEFREFLSRGLLPRAARTGDEPRDVDARLLTLDHH